ncbi:MAG: hypothetical protein LBK71_08055, partial [Verrucomicrobiales bacterium]|nr:hypothetical protein [Verrucomicrobiales bacterium]
LTRSRAHALTRSRAHALTRSRAHLKPLISRQGFTHFIPFAVQSASVSGARVAPRPRPQNNPLRSLRSFAAIKLTETNYEKNNME